MTKDKEDDNLKKTPPQPLVSMPLTLPARLAKTWVILPILTKTRKVTTRQSVLSQERTETPQKTSNSLGNLRVKETNVNDAPEAIFEWIPCIWYSTTFCEKSVLTQKSLKCFFLSWAGRGWFLGMRTLVENLHHPGIPSNY